jgi:hypothetical protein
MLSLSSLEEALKLAEDTSDYMVALINRSRHVGVDVSPLWFIWVALIARILRDLRIPTTAASGDKQRTDSPFVLFIHDLQQWLPSSYRKRQSMGSIAKGIQTARSKFGRYNSATLLGMLFACALGVQEFPLPPLGPRTRLFLGINRALRESGVSR